MPGYRQRKFASSPGRAAASCEIEPCIYLWALRILVLLGGHREFLNVYGFSNDSLAEGLGLGRWLDPELADFDRKPVLADLRERHAKAERDSARVEVPRCLARNISRVAALVGLGETERRLLGFTVLLHADNLLMEASDALGSLSSVGLFHVLAVVLDVPEEDVRVALSPDGTLARSGILSLERTGSGHLRPRLDLLSEDFADHLLSSDSDPVMLLRDIVTAAPPAELTFEDYGHVAPILRVLRPYLERALEGRLQSVNVLIHGPPGTGKTQLTRVLANAYECELFEVASQDVDGDPLRGSARLRSYRAAQSFFAKRRAMIVFDEIEDAFDDGSSVLFGARGPAQSSKGWVNRILEENPVPALWLSNAVEGLDPAFLRRFDVVLELPVPPRSQRERIIRATCGDLIDERDGAALAASEALAPALVTRAAKVVRAVRDRLDQAEASTAVRRLIGSTLDAQGFPGLERDDPAALPELYDTIFVNADIDVSTLIDRLQRSREVRICLYGPPGTGKTAYAQWLARQLDMRLEVRRASDLLGAFVGQSEQNVAHAFRSAEQNGAVLLIDEVDSFLQDRRRARQTWEVSLVNELLTQMEAFRGIFVASTNLMDGLDQGALRRFDLKIFFDFLRPEQAWELLCRHCAAARTGRPDSSLHSEIAQLRNLAPGDFEAVAQMQRFRPLSCAADWLEALRAECALKATPARPAGFILPAE